MHQLKKTIFFAFQTNCLFEHAKFSKENEDERKNLEDIIQFSTKKKMNWERKLNILKFSRWRYGEEEMQQPTCEQQVCNNVMYRQEDKLDMEIQEMRMLLMKVYQRRKFEVRRTTNNRVHLIL